MATLKVGDVMTRNVEVIQADANLDVCDTIMKLEEIRHLPVMRGQALAGLVSQRDLLRAQQSRLANLTEEERLAFNREVKASDIMTTEVVSVSPETSVVEAAKLMREGKYGCLPVIEGPNLVGIVTETDLLDLAIRMLGDVTR